MPADEQALLTCGGAGGGGGGGHFIKQLVAKLHLYAPPPLLSRVRMLSRKRARNQMGVISPHLNGAGCSGLQPAPGSQDPVQPSLTEEPQDPEGASQPTIVDPLDNTDPMYQDSRSGYYATYKVRVDSLDKDVLLDTLRMQMVLGPTLYYPDSNPTYNYCAVWRKFDFDEEGWGHLENFITPGATLKLRNNRGDENKRSVVFEGGDDGALVRVSDTIEARDHRGDEFYILPNSLLDNHDISMVAIRKSQISKKSIAAVWKQTGLTRTRLVCRTPIIN